MEKKQTGSLKEALLAYQKPMERMYYFFLVLILLYEVLGSTSLLYDLTLGAAGMMSGMDPDLAGLLWQSFVNLRFLIVIPAIYTIVVEVDSRKEQLLLCAMLLLAWFYFIYMRQWNDTVMFKALLLVVASYGRDFKKIAKCSMIVVSLVLLLSLILSLLGIIPEFNLVRNGRIRHSFGMLGPVTFAGHVSFVLLTMVFLKDGALKWTDCALLLGLSILNVLFVDGRAALLAVLLTIAASGAYMLYRRIRFRVPKLLSKLYELLLLSSYVWIAGGYMIAMLTYRPDPTAFYHRIAFLSSYEGRFSVPHSMLSELPPSLFGNYFEKYDAMFSSLEEVADGMEVYTFLDSSYARQYMIYGIVGLLCAVAIFSGIQYRLHKAHQGFRMVMMAIVALIFVVERGLVEPGYNIFMLLLFAKLPPAADSGTIALRPADQAEEC